MGELIFPDFVTKSRQYTKGGGIDDLDIVDVAEVGLSDRHNAVILERMRGIPANVGPVDPREAGYPINVYDTAPSEMPPVQPMYVAPEKDPA